MVQKVKVNMYIDYKKQTLMVTKKEFETIKNDPNTENVISNEEVQKGWFTIEYRDGTATDAEIIDI